MFKICVFASHGGSNLQAIIDATHKKQIDAKVALVISNNSDSMALTRAKNASIPNFHISSFKFPDIAKMNEEILRLLHQHKIDLIFLAGYLKKLNPNIIKEYAGNIFNIHPSLLPKFGGKGMFGKHVHAAVLASGDKFTGITIHQVDEDYDKGQIINQCKVRVFKFDNINSLSKRVLKKEHTFIVDAIKKIINSKRKQSLAVPRR